jgi:SAM-dependent methyltransferase/uncharacterized protein YbaR (Trm112 family)
MRLRHFETLKPVCPRCLLEHNTAAALIIDPVARQQDDMIIEGSLRCPQPQCRQRYPIIDGIPIIVSQIQRYLNDNFYAITRRDDLSPVTESLLGDAAGPRATFNTIRHHLGTYAWDHYGDVAPDNEFEHSPQRIAPGSVDNCLQAGLQLFDQSPQPPVLDIGCAAGRTTFELGATDNGLALGIDMDISLLRLAQRLLREDHIDFPLKRTGLRYDRHSYPVIFEHKTQVDFWACNALALPFAGGQFQFVNALNVLDTVNSPQNLLHAINRQLSPGGGALLATPYDWSMPVPVENWIGGQSLQDTEDGDSTHKLRQLLTPGKHPQSVTHLDIVGEIEHHPWHVRVHSRRVASYDTHIIACRKV